MTVMTTPKPATRAKVTTAAMMKALVYQGPGKKALEDRPKPELTAPTDAIVKITKTTICGTDLHILKGDVADLPARPHPRPRGRRHRRRGRRRRHGLQAGRPRADLLHQRLRQVRVLPQAACTRTARPAAGSSATRSTARRPSTCAFRMPTPASIRFPTGADEEALVMLSDILPTGFECGVLNGKVAAGQHRGDRRCRADRARGAADRAVLLAGRDHHDRSRRQPARRWRSASAPPRRSTAPTARPPRRSWS